MYNTMYNVTIEELEDYFSNKQKNNTQWMQIKRCAIQHLYAQGLKTIEISDIIGVGRKSVWENKSQEISENTKKNFEKIIKKKLYPIKVVKVNEKWVEK